MRWLFFVVFSLNLAYVAWELNRSSADTYIDVQPLKNVQPIILLSELKQVEELDAQEDGAKEEDAQQAGTREDEESIAVQEPVQQDDAIESASSEQGQAVEEQAALDVVESPLDTGKAAGEIVVAENKGGDTVEVLQAEPPQAANCYTLGPFRDLDKLRGLTREIKSYVDTTDFRGREEKEPPLYWVYTKPEKNRSKALATAKRLKAKKIKDLYIIRDGEKINGVSLGYFRNKDGAGSLVKKMKKLGFDVVLERVIKSHTIYWLDYQVSSGKSIPEEIFDKHLESAKKDKISRLSRDCDS